MVLTVGSLFRYKHLLWTSFLFLTTPKYTSFPHTEHFSLSVILNGSGNPNGFGIFGAIYAH